MGIKRWLLDYGPGVGVVLLFVVILGTMGWRAHKQQNSQGVVVCSAAGDGYVIQGERTYRLQECPFRND